MQTSIINTADKFESMITLVKDAAEKVANRNFPYDPFMREAMIEKLVKEFIKSQESLESTGKTQH